MLGDSTWEKSMKHKMATPATLARVVAMATPRTPSDGRPNSPSTKAVSRMALSTFMMAVTYIEMRVYPWLRRMAVTELRMAWVKMNPPTISRYSQPYSKMSPCAPSAASSGR